ncbi:hypothetical protein V1460_21530 [Streptomyces sp. SCSIO 30461]|uniref:hypothetical protein n=1 Tax=Streptomyces sp. SCSIO 30461 TaxID=3118085 RepID=UPI0030CDA8CE
MNRSSPGIRTLVAVACLLPATAACSAPPECGSAAAAFARYQAEVADATSPGALAAASHDLGSTLGRLADTAEDETKPALREMSAAWRSVSIDASDPVAASREVSQLAPLAERDARRIAQVCS